MTLTSKRQATLPVETCESLGLKPGDTIELEPRFEDGQAIWILRARPNRSREWIGCLGKHAKKVDDHSMAAVRKSIMKARRRISSQ